MHVFKYSPRKGTVAASMPNQIDGKIKEKRSQILINLSDENQKAYNKKYLSEPQEVLFEEEKNGIWSGYTSNYIKISIKSNENLENKIININPKEIIKEY